MSKVISIKSRTKNMMDRSCSFFEDGLESFPKSSLLLPYTSEMSAACVASNTAVSIFYQSMFYVNVYQVNHEVDLVFF